MNIIKHISKKRSIFMALLLAFGLAASAQFKFATRNAFLPHGFNTTLVSFTGEANGCTAVLSWSVIDEEANTVYKIQYSSNGVEFRNAGLLCDAASPVEYDYVATLPIITQTSYYRLEIIAPGKRAVYSDAILIESDCGAVACK